MGILIIWIILAFVVAGIGETRTTGFWGSFLLAIFLSPVIGLIIVLISKSKTQAAIEQGLLNQLADKNKPTHEETEAKLKKIQEMMDSKLITESEYALMRKEVINKALTILFVVLISFSCKRDEPNKYGCVWGKNKTTFIREFIRCGHLEIYQSGNNQTSADLKANNLGIPKENVLVMNSYTNWEFIPTENCDCQ